MLNHIQKPESKKLMIEFGQIVGFWQSAKAKLLPKTYEDKWRFIWICFQIHTKVTEPRDLGSKYEREFSEYFVKQNK